LLTALISMLPPGPSSAGCAAFPYAWSNDPLSCLDAPAGLVRIETSQFQVMGRLDGDGSDPGISAGAAAFNLGSFAMGAGGSWVRTGDSDTLLVKVAVSKVLKGDPIGFMEGIFGPSISAGGTLGWSRSADGANCLAASVGFQFSVFPTVAIGVDVSGLRLAGDPLVNRTIGYGVTYIYDRDFRAHLSVRDKALAIGAELAVTDHLTVRTGSAGGSWDTGLTIGLGSVSLDYAVRLDRTSASHFTGISFVPGGSP